LEECEIDIDMMVTLTACRGTLRDLTRK
jgi:hypothetical protein